MGGTVLRVPEPGIAANGRAAAPQRYLCLHLPADTLLADCLELNQRRLRRDSKEKEMKLWWR